MDDVILSLLHILVAVLCVPLAAEPVDLTFVTSAQISELRAKFEAAKMTEANLATLAKRSSWRCDLYGVRTQLQVKRGIEVYRFERIVPTTDLRNTGAQPISTYAFKRDSLVGAGERGVVDEVRLTEQSELIARLSLPERGVTVAYTLCRGS